MSKRRQSEQPWKVPVAVTDVPETGKRVELIADTGTRAAVAHLAGIPGVQRLEAQFDLTRHGREGLRVAGRVSATVEQNCVVTLEPMHTDIEEPVDLVFAASAGDAMAPQEIEQIHTLDDDEPPQALENGVVDLGALATEFLLLGIDPYPRKPGAVFDAPSVGDAEAHPFAALSALKKDFGGKRS
jgi:uncharacterized metal-binding protein YceD (DUF177 family)